MEILHETFDDLRLKTQSKTFWLTLISQIGTFSAKNLNYLSILCYRPVTPLVLFTQRPLTILRELCG
jgi:hypothetical protein